jgi:hypothetical protein
MATHADDPIDLREQIARIDQMRANSDKLYAETQKLLAEGRVVSLATIFQAMLATAALLGAGAAIAKLFFP